MPRRFLLLFLFVLVAGLLLFVPLPVPPTYAGRTIEDSGHAPLFLIGTLFVLIILRNDLQMEGWRHYAWGALIGAGAGVLSEAIQRPLRRDASWEDVLADCVGVLLALALYALFDRRARFGGRTRFVALLVAIGCVAAMLGPVVKMTRAYMHRNGQFPVLADFRSKIEGAWVVGYGTNRKISGDALEAEFARGSFPGFSFYEPVPDWRPYKTLFVDVENPDGKPLTLGIRIHDIGHGRTYADRFNRNFALAPGERRTLAVPLEDVRRAPRNRLMNMGQISDVTLFRGEDTGAQRVRLHSMRLQ